MSLEGTNGTFCSVPAVHAWWYQLEFVVPGICDGGLVCSACFIVQDLGGDINAVVLQAFHDFVVHWYMVLVMLHLEWLDQDAVGTNMIPQHYVLIATL